MTGTPMERISCYGIDLSLTPAHHS